jgi:hypothetical protein
MRTNSKFTESIEGKGFLQKVSYEWNLLEPTEKQKY